MKICLVCNEFPPYKCGGIGIFSNELANALISKGYEVIAIGMYPDIEEDITLENGLRIVRLKSWGGKSSVFTNSVRLGYKIKNLIKSGDIDIVELPDFEGLAAFWPKINVPIITRLHGSVTYFAREMKQRESKATTFIEKRSLSNSDYICSVSQYTAEMTKQIFGIDTNIKIIYNGVKIPESSKCKSSYGDIQIVSFSGTLMRKKGVLSLAKAWVLVKEDFPNAKLRLIGKHIIEDGMSVKEKILEIVGDELKDSIEFTGHVPKEKMEELLIESDLAVYPSISESFGLAPIEAMSLGLPVIFSKRSAGEELGHELKSLKLIDPDNIQEIAQTICDLLGNKKIRKDIGLKNREDVMKYFNADKKIDENIKFYEKCING